MIGVVLGTSDLVWADKLTVTVRTLPNGDEIAELPKRSEHYARTLYQMRINEIIKGNKLVRSGQTINVLILGPRTVSHRVVLSAEQKYLLQLSSLADAEKYKGTVVMDLLHSSGAKQQFDTNNVFTPTRDVNNAVPVTKDTKELIKRIRHDTKR